MMFLSVELRLCLLSLNLGRVLVVVLRVVISVVLYSGVDFFWLVMCKNVMYIFKCLSIVLLLVNWFIYVLCMRFSGRDYIKGVWVICCMNFFLLMVVSLVCKMNCKKCKLRFFLCLYFIFLRKFYVVLCWLVEINNFLFRFWINV